MYENMDNYINGAGVEKNKKRAAMFFNEIAELDKESLKVRAMVKDAGFYKVIGTMPDGILYYMDDRTALGKNVSDVVLYLRDPLNEDVLFKIMSRIEAEWNK
jgi:TPR repeat protein